MTHALQTIAFLIAWLGAVGLVAIARSRFEATKEKTKW